MKTGLVLEGGGMRGIYTAGILDVFIDEGITFDGVIGVSAGAIHGCTYVAGQRGRNLRYYKKYCNDKRFMSFRNLILTGDIAAKKFCYEDLPKRLDPFDYEAYTKSNVDFYVTCTNVETGEAEYLLLKDMDKEIDLLRASASLPYVSRIVRYQGKKYLDGGCADSIPVEAFRKMGYEKSVVVLTRHLGYHKEPEKSGFAPLLYGRYKKFIQTMKERHINYNRTLEKIKELESEEKIFVIRPSEELKIGRMEKDPDKLQQVYDLGVCDAKKHLKSMKEWLEK